MTFTQMKPPCFSALTNVQADDFFKQRRLHLTEENNKII